MIDANVVNNINLSFGRCLTSTIDGKAFLDTFYDNFLSSSSLVKARFANTDFTKQKFLLKQGLTMIIMFASNSPIAKSAIERLTLTHDHNHLNIDPSMYTYWVNSLMQSVKLHDKKYTPELEKEWRDVVALGINHMKSGY